MTTFPRCRTQDRSDCPTYADVPPSSTELCTVSVLRLAALAPFKVSTVIESTRGRAAPSGGDREPPSDSGDLEVYFSRAKHREGGELESLLDKLRERGKRRRDLRAAIERRAGMQAQTLDRSRLETSVRRRVDDWRGLLLGGPLTADTSCEKC
jgi:hypothetical protein